MTTPGLFMLSRIKKGEETILKEPFLKKDIEDPLVKVCQGDKNTLKTPWVKSGMGAR